MNKTMTNAEMRKLFDQKLAWFEKDEDGSDFDDWRMPIWTEEGSWWLNNTTNLYELDSKSAT